MKIVRFLTIAFCLIHLNTFANSGEPYNYYVPAPDKLLENVEKYHLQQGISKVKKGQFEYAWSEFAFMLHYFPNHPHALRLISDLAIQMEDTARPIKYFERAIKLYPNEAPTYALYGVFLHKNGKLEDAISYYKKAIQIDKKPAEFHYNLGLAYLEMNDLENAFLAAQTAYRLGYPLPALKEKLMAKGAWKSDADKTAG